MKSKSVEVYGKSYDAGIKFDYFVCGVAGTLFAYIVQTYHAQKLQIGFSALEPLSLLLLAASFFAGIKRIEASLFLTKMNHQILDASENLVDIMSVDAELKQNDVGIPSRKADLNLKIADWSDKLERYKPHAEAFYIWRNRLLLLGFAAIFLSKALQPYAETANEPSIKASPPPAERPNNKPLPPDSSRKTIQS